MPGHAFAWVLEHDVVLRAAPDSHGLLFQLVLLDLRLATEDK
jgi:hypothetical protein